MTNKNYEKGVRFEREILDIFKKEGYTCSRSAGSHSPFDFTLVKKTTHNTKTVYLMAVGQCKVKKNG